MPIPSSGEPACLLFFLFKSLDLLTHRDFTLEACPDYSDLCFFPLLRTPVAFTHTWCGLTSHHSMTLCVVYRIVCLDDNFTILVKKFYWTVLYITYLFVISNNILGIWVIYCEVSIASQKKFCYRFTGRRAGNLFCSLTLIPCLLESK